MRAVRLAFHHRRSRIGGGPDRHVQRDLAEERHAEPLRLMPRTAMTEDVRSGAAMRALEVAHILDNTEHGDIDLLEHREPTPRVDQGKVLRCRNDDRALQRHVLRERPLRISGARWHVEDEYIERAPRTGYKSLG